MKYRLLETRHFAIVFLFGIIWYNSWAGNDGSDIEKPCERKQEGFKIQNDLAQNSSKLAQRIGLREAVPPKPVHFDPKSEECRNWVEAHRNYCGKDEADATQALLDQVKFIKFETLLQNLKAQIQKFKNLIRNSPFVIVYDPGKSSEWLTSFLINEFGDKKFELVPADQFHEFATNPKNKNIVDIVRIEDGIYSGEQMRKYASKIKDVQQINQKPLTLHVLAGYTTPRGKSNVFKEDEAGVLETLIMDSTPFDGIHTTMMKRPQNDGKKILETLTRMYGHGLDNPKHGNELTDLFFEHKVPDNLSALEEFFGFGQVKCKQRKNPSDPTSNILHGKKSGKPIEFHCIPQITPPYKRADHRDFITTEDTCKNPKDDSEKTFCQSYAEDKKEFVTTLKPAQ